MAQSKKTNSKGRTSGNKKTTAAKAQPTEPVVPIRRELGGVIFLLLALFTAVGYFRDEGAFICFVSNLLKGLVGWGYWITAPAFFMVGIILLFHRGRPVTLRSVCAMSVPIIFSAFISFFLYEYNTNGMDVRQLAAAFFEQGQSLRSAGVFGGLIAAGLEMAFSIYAAVPVLLILLILCLMCMFKRGFKKAANRVRVQVTTKYDPSMYEDALQPVPSVNGRTPATYANGRIQRVSRPSYVGDIPLGDDEDVISLLDGRSVKDLQKSAADNGTTQVKTVTRDTVESAVNFSDSAKAENTRSKRRSNAVTASAEISDPPRVKKIKREEIEAEAQNVAETISATEDAPDYDFPPMNLLRSSSGATIDARDEIELNRERLEGALRSFGIGASIVGVTHGPTVTRYDIELEQGVKLARITNLAGDLALALGVVNVRIAPIPEKISTVGIEVPNRIVSTVYLRDIIDTPKFAAAKSKLSFALGKDIGGDCIIGNISKLPHMLIAGTTGSGKSVCMNSLILSLLYKSRPDEVKLIMIDPKMVELGVYNGIPHLYVPVVTDPKKAAGALQWAVVEMLKRYRMFSEVSVRDLDSYNKHCISVGESTMPRVVIVIDELADLMLVASKEVEESICRVAQMGRAAGMHLVIATQRPSADVITGLMKANIPSRIAFAVSSAMESRIILDQGGAEKLVGMGDMLFSPVGCGKPVRIQGAFVSDEEREDVIQYIKENSGDVQKNSEIEEYMNKAAEAKSGGSDGGKNAKESKDSFGGYDEMLPQAVEVVLETKSCSVSMLQRRLKLGYARAARIVDQMEELGVVGESEGAKPRRVLADREGWNALMRENGLVCDEDMSNAAELSGE